jgi:hypothetical protein
MALTDNAQRAWRIILTLDDASGRPMHSAMCLDEYGRLGLASRHFFGVAQDTMAKYRYWHDQWQEHLLDRWRQEEWDQITFRWCGQCDALVEERSRSSVLWARGVLNRPLCSRCESIEEWD